MATGEAQALVEPPRRGAPFANQQLHQAGLAPALCIDGPSRHEMAEAADEGDLEAADDGARVLLGDRQPDDGGEVATSGGPKRYFPRYPA
jgi:hypothetical protein